MEKSRRFKKMGRRPGTGILKIRLRHILMQDKEWQGV
jgi:hypothetical protein